MAIFTIAAAAAVATAGILGPPRGHPRLDREDHAARAGIRAGAAGDDVHRPACRRRLDGSGRWAGSTSARFWIIAITLGVRILRRGTNRYPALLEKKGRPAVRGHWRAGFVDSGGSWPAQERAAAKRRLANPAERRTALATRGLVRPGHGYRGCAGTLGCRPGGIPLAVAALDSVPRSP